MYCAVFGCLNSSTSHPEYSFFKLPSDTERRSKWLRLISREDLENKPPQNYTVCEAHFDTLNILSGAFRKKLKKNALPALHLPDLQKINNTPSTRIARRRDKQILFEVPTFIEKCIQTDEVITRDTSDTTQTSESLSSDISRKSKLKCDLLKCKKIMKFHKFNNKTGKYKRVIFNKLCDRFLTKELSEMVKVQSYLKFNHTKNRYHERYKTFCLNLYYNSPQVYRLLQNALCLPCYSTLNKHRISVTTEINDNLMSIVKTKVEAMSDIEKNCSVMINVMSLKFNLFYNINKDKIIGFHEIDGVQSPEPANNALVVMVRGIFVNWKQPLAFALLSECRNYDEIAKWIDKLLDKLFDIGLNVRTFVSDVESNITNALKNISVTVDRPYFMVNNKKIYHVFDAPQLMKLFRNNFITYDYHFDDRVAKYDHIVQFYEKDKQKTFKLAHKLTNSHIYPTNFEKMKVCYAAQLLSNSLATGISTYIDFNVIEESGRGTVELIKNMNNLFDALNSSDLKEDYEYRQAFCGKESQIIFFREMINFFRQLKLIDPKNGNDVTSEVKFIKGFQITITSILLLFQDLKSEGCTVLFTRRLNQDVLETFFDRTKTRIKGSLPKKPTCRQFMSAFQNMFFSHVKKLSKVGNYAEHLGEFLLQTNTLGPLNEVCDSVTSHVTKATIGIDDESSNVQIMSSEYNQLDFPKEKPLLYICSYLLKKCAERHEDCQILKSYIKPNNSQDFRTESHYLRYKDYNKHTNRRLSVVPTDDFVKFVEKMDEILRNCFQREYNINCKIAALIYKEIDKVFFLTPCPCFPLVYLKKLFIRMRIFYTIKLNNIAFRTSPDQRRPFSVNHLS